MQKNENNEQIHNDDSHTNLKVTPPNQISNPSHVHKPPKKSLFSKLLCGLKLFDEMIMQMYLQLTGSFDAIIADVEISHFMKKILHAKQILFFLVLFLNFYLIYNTVNVNVNVDVNVNINISEISNSSIFLLKKIIFYLFTVSFFIIISLIFLLKVRSSDSMYITRHEELEKFILSKNPELNNNQCEACKVTRCMRSQHCNLCNHCVAKFELHSDWFHICIGSLNYLTYILILIFLNFFYFFSLVNLLFQIFILASYTTLYDFKGKEFQIHFWAVLLFYLNIKIFSFTFDLIKMSVIKNLTDHEGYNWRRLPYLWRSMRKDYFNPFDKGVKGNLKEIWISFCNPQIKLADRINLSMESNVNISTSINTNMSENEGVDSSFGLETQNLKKNENFQNFGNFENFENFITKDFNVVYRQYSGKVDDYINWNKVRFYTIFDLKNSPFRDVIMKQMSVSGV